MNPSEEKTELRTVEGLKLRPCPFCAGEVTLQPFTNGGAYFVVCPEGSPCRRSKMLITIKEETLLEGIEIWNTRQLYQP